MLSTARFAPHAVVDDEHDLADMTGAMLLAEAVREMHPAVLANHQITYLYTAKPYTIETVLKLLQT